MGFAIFPLDFREHPSGLEISPSGFRVFPSGFGIFPEVRLKVGLGGVVSLDYRASLPVPKGQRILAGDAISAKKPCPVSL